MSERKSPGEKTSAPQPEGTASERSPEDLDELLDEALAETFPASDPIELSSSTD